MQTQQCNFPITYNFPFQLQECWNSILCRKNVQKQHDKSLVRFRGRFRSARENRPKMQLHKTFSLFMSIRFFMYEENSNKLPRNIRRFPPRSFVFSDRVPNFTYQGFHKLGTTHYKSGSGSCCVKTKLGLIFRIFKIWNSEFVKPYCEQLKT